ncbi:MAG: winged helix-turn-helix transcriptional regulator [Candidatus Taylorbacteria bacterium]|nr:winged helix-turn-helix transcriptional regulator [Candidatus Taylorbacteria bacterium]
MSFCDEIQKLGKGIGSNVRYKILESLLKGPLTVGEIVKSIRLSQPAVSQHLKTLKACQLVSGQKRGKEVFYSVNVKHMAKLLKHFIANIGKCPR